MNTKRFLNFRVLHSSLISALLLCHPLHSQTAVYLSASPVYAGTMQPSQVFVEPSYYGLYARTKPGFTEVERNALLFASLLEQRKHRITASEFLETSLEVRPSPYFSFGLASLSGRFILHDVPASKGMSQTYIYFYEPQSTASSNNERAPFYLHLFVLKNQLINEWQLIPEVSLLYPVTLLEKKADFYLRFGMGFDALRYSYKPGFRIAVLPFASVYAEFPVRYWKLRSSVFNDVSTTPRGYPNLNFSFPVWEKAVMIGMAIQISPGPLQSFSLDKKRRRRYDDPYRDLEDLPETPPH